MPTVPTKPAMAVTAARRLLLVHAHPDDETITNGATMAHYVAAGAHVTLVTCTRGEQGEILVPDLAHLAADRDDALGPYRETELAAAMAVLGVSDHRFLGDAAPGRPARVYRDSGMAYAPDGSVTAVPDAPPDAFALADVDEAARSLADVVRELRPQVLVTYEPGGGYGHPDHVQAHRVAMRAAALAAAGEGAGGPAWQVPKIYWTALPQSRLEPGIPRMSMVLPDEQVTTCIDADALVGRKAAALLAHATQLSVEEGFFALSNGIRQPLVGTEYYRLAVGTPAGPFDADGRETDLFAGL